MSKPRRSPFEAAEERGKRAAQDGVPEGCNPYDDGQRTHYGGITWARAFNRAWLKGHRSVTGYAP